MISNQVAGVNIPLAITIKNEQDNLNFVVRRNQGVTRKKSPPISPEESKATLNVDRASLIPLKICGFQINGQSQQNIPPRFFIDVRHVMQQLRLIREARSPSRNISQGPNVSMHNDNLKPVITVVNNIELKNFL